MPPTPHPSCMSQSCVRCCSHVQAPEREADAASVSSSGSTRGKRSRAASGPARSQQPATTHDKLDAAVTAAKSTPEGAPPKKRHDLGDTMDVEPTHRMLPPAFMPPPPPPAKAYVKVDDLTLNPLSINNTLAPVTRGSGGNAGSSQTTRQRLRALPSMHRPRRATMGTSRAAAKRPAKSSLRQRPVANSRGRRGRPYCASVQKMRRCSVQLSLRRETTQTCSDITRELVRMDGHQRWTRRAGV